MNTSSLPYQCSETTGVLANSRKVVGLLDTDYHGDKDIQSCSMLKKILVSPAHYQSALFAPFSQTPAMEFGTLVHALILEPATIASRFAIYPGSKVKYDKDFRAFKDSRKGVHCIDETMFHLAEQAANKLLEQKVLGRKFGDFVSEGEPEASIYYDDPTTNIPCRTRIDLCHPEATFDVKTTTYPTLAKWAPHAVDLDYDLQAFMYTLSEHLFHGAEKMKPFIFMTVESDQPFSTGARPASLDILRNGKKKYEHALGTLNGCTITDFWPTPGGEEEFTLSHWQTFSPDSSWLTSTTTL